MELTPGENTLLFHEGHDDEDYEHEDMASMPLDEEHPTVIELSEEQEVLLEWLTTNNIQHIRVQEVL